MSELPTAIEILDYKTFPKPLQTGALGMVFGKITNGLTTNFFSDLVYPYDLGADGSPSIGITFALRAIRYSATSEILVALQFLQGHGWFEDKVQFMIYGADPFDEIRTEGWAEEWSVSARVDLAFYLEDVVGGLCQRKLA